MRSSVEYVCAATDGSRAVAEGRGACATDGTSEGLDVTSVDAALDAAMRVVEAVIAETDQRERRRVARPAAIDDELADALRDRLSMVSDAAEWALRTTEHPKEHRRGIRKRQ